MIFFRLCAAKQDSWSPSLNLKKEQKVIVKKRYKAILRKHYLRADTRVTGTLAHRACGVNRCRLLKQLPSISGVLVYEVDNCVPRVLWYPSSAVSQEFMFSSTFVRKYFRKYFRMFYRRYEDRYTSCTCTVCCKSYVYT